MLFQVGFFPDYCLHSCILWGSTVSSETAVALLRESEGVIPFSKRFASKLSLIGLFAPIVLWLVPSFQKTARLIWRAKDTIWHDMINLFLHGTSICLFLTIGHYQKGTPLDMNRSYKVSHENCLRTHTWLTAWNIAGWVCCQWNQFCCLLINLPFPFWQSALLHSEIKTILWLAQF